MAALQGSAMPVARAAEETELEALAAIAAAASLIRRRSVSSKRHRHDSGEQRPSEAWRFSGRWWAVPLPARRDRPWVSR